MSDSIYEKVKEESRIETAIKSEIDDVIHALFVINMDDYVAVRDEIGQDKMDAAMELVDKAFHQIFRGNDIVVRLRGDEFIVLAKNVKELGNVEFLATKIVDTVLKTEIGQDRSLSCSVGVAIYPFQGKNYDDLKVKAYRAMYRAKANGKKTYRLYDAAHIKLIYHDYVFDKEAYAKNKDCDLNVILANKSLLEICTILLRDDKSALSAMNSMLEIACTYLGFSRVYFQAVEGMRPEISKLLTYSNPGFEYTAESEVMKALREDMQIRIAERYKSLTLIDSDDQTVDEEVRLTLKDKDVNQLLYFPLAKDESFLGAFIFENMSVEKISFSEEELQDLEEQMRSIQSYFFSSHAKKFAKENVAKLDMFENIPAAVYIIDTESHMIAFANKWAKEHADGGHIGDFCYNVFAHKSSACANCPIKNMDPNDEHANGVLSQFNYLTRQWSYNLFSWMGVYENKNQAVMISVDVSDFVNDLNQIDRLAAGTSLKDL